MIVLPKTARGRWRTTRSLGVVIMTGGNPTLHRNRVSKNRHKAIRVLEGGQGVIEDNDLSGNPKGAWDIAPDCEENVRRARNKE